MFDKSLGVIEKTKNIYYYRYRNFYLTTFNVYIEKHLKDKFNIDLCYRDYETNILIYLEPIYDNMLNMSLINLNFITCNVDSNLDKYPNENLQQVYDYLKAYNKYNKILNIINYTNKSTSDIYDEKLKYLKENIKKGAIITQQEFYRGKLIGDKTKFEILYVANDIAMLDENNDYKISNWFELVYGFLIGTHNFDKNYLRKLKIKSL